METALKHFEAIQGIRDEICIPLIALVSELESYEEVENLVLKRFIAEYGNKAEWTELVEDAYKFSVFTLLLVYHT